MTHFVANALDQDDFRLKQPKIMNLIDSDKLVRDAGGTEGLRKRKPVPAFPRPALARRGFGVALAGLVPVILLALVLALATPARATEIQRVVSPAGIEAWLVEEHSIPLISIQFAFVGGAAQDPSGKEGLANMVSGLLDEGAGDLDAQAFQSRLEELAVRLSFDAGRDMFTGRLKTLSRHAADAFELLRLAINSPRFDADAVERIRAQILTGLKFQEQDPNDMAGRLWFKTAFGDHPYGRPVDGDAGSVAAIGADDLKSYARHIFARDHLKIAVVGDIDATTLAGTLDKIFAALPAKAELAPVARTSVASGPIRRIVDMDIPQTVIQFGQAGLARRDPDFISAYIVNHILGGGGFSSRLYTEVREKRGLAYSVYTYLYPLDYSAVLLGGVATQNGRAAQSLATIESELKRLAQDGPTADELAHAKSYLTGSYALHFDTSDKIAGQLVAIQVEDLGIDYINRRNSLIAAVTIKDVKRVAQRLLEPGRLITTVVGRPTGLEEIRPGG